MSIILDIKVSSGEVNSMKTNNQTIRIITTQNLAALLLSRRT